MNKLIMLIGYPGSGKTTYARKLRESINDIVIHSSDGIRYELYGDAAKQGDPKKVFSILNKRARVDLKSGKNVIIDATNMKKKDRTNTLNNIMLGDLHPETIAVIMDTDISACKENNRLRERMVPCYVYDIMQREYDQPTTEEGFDQIITVKQRQDQNGITTALPLKNADAIEYIGTFFDPEELYKKVKENIGPNRLEKKIGFPHVTFQYQPDHIDHNLWGETVCFEIVGYGNDSINEGLMVKLEDCVPAIKDLFEKIAVPHITISIGKYGEAVNTRYLDYFPITPIRIKGIFGGMTYSGELKQ